MTLEPKLFNLLKQICPRVFPDVAPLKTLKPYITWQQVGGQAPSFIDNTVPTLRNATIQINVWAATRSEATTLALQIEAALITSTALQARPVGALIATSEEDLGLRGTAQDFDIWATR